VRKPYGVRRCLYRTTNLLAASCVSQGRDACVSLCLTALPERATMCDVVSP
jgi:hypothetical protein